MKRFVLYTRHVMCKVALHVMGRFWKKVLCQFETTFSHVKQAPQASLYVEEASLMLSKVWLVHCGFHSHITYEFFLVFMLVLEPNFISIE